MNKLSRRRFVKNVGLSAPVIGAVGLSNSTSFRQGFKAPHDKLPREVWIASMTQYKIEGRNMKEVISAALSQMEMALPFSPDIICLPEEFHVAGVKEGRPSLEKSLEDGSGNIIEPFQEFAKNHNCNIICPVRSLEGNKMYNSAFVINRNGEVVGNYRKIRPTIQEIEMGIIPGPQIPPLFEMDFGKIGIQICYDIEWSESWEQLRNMGAEMVFWPSAFAGGEKVNAKAWTNQYYVVSSTRKDTTKICDVTGEVIAASGNWSRWGICASVNLEKVILPSYPSSYRFPEIQKKYGRKINCTSYHEEEFSVIESLSPDLKVKDILREFDLVSYKDTLLQAEEHQRNIL